MAAPYTDQIIFPERVLIDRPELANRRFPGWAGSVLVISVENQGVCAWGVPLGNDNPEILIGGEIQHRAGWVRGTERYCYDTAAFVAARKWDASCLSQGPLLQAQAAELDAGTLSVLRQQCEQRPTTTGWPGHTVHRWERLGAKIMLWDSRGQCDWWVSATDLTALHAVAEFVHPLSDLGSSLWSNDPDGIALLRRVRARD
ncbi:hypothetical protein [Actinoplanes utahensis]|uniref:Uncharacterized protein n=1 Tax=Actinoplanes utahensis TaxID=1869 RepID=A0A0A6X0T2_ACTUT|nr:hypothetical protein [Actinoplanes utahensis]KHD73632.1 hypothetical protein MB27_33130 [Actinoplanes utahensis]